VVDLTLNVHIFHEQQRARYGVATIGRLLKMIGLFCRILSLLLVSFAKETYHLKEPTNRSHPIVPVLFRSYRKIVMTPKIGTT